MSRTLTIPPVNAPGGEAGTGRMEVLLELVDANGDPIPGADPINTLAIHGLGSYVVTDTAVEIELSTQDELADETYYRVTVRQGRSEFRRDVQVPAGTDITWAQFLGLSDPVTSGLAWAARLLPTGATDGQFATYDAATGLWEPISVAPGAGLGIGDDAALLGSGTATDGQVLTADGIGGAAWQDAIGGSSATKLDDLAAPDDNTDLNVSTSAHGLAPKAVAPAAGALNVYGIANSETAIGNKTIFEGLLKVIILTRAAYDALGPGRPSATLYICNG